MVVTDISPYCAVKERRAIIKDRVEALSVLIDDDGSGTLDIEVLLTATF